MTQLEQLKNKLSEICDLNNAACVLGWDQQTYMPHGGGSARAEQLATLGRLSHEKFANPEVGALLDGASRECEASAYESDEASLIRVTRREYERACKIPSSLVAEIAKASSLGMEVWVAARQQSDFGLFKDALAQIFSLHRQLAACLGFEASIYDPLLDQYEPKQKTAQLKLLFGDLKQSLVPLVQKVTEKLHVVDDSVLKAYYPEKAQWDFGMEALKSIGFDLGKGRLDKSVHPFTTSFSIHDVRITTRMDEHFFPMAFGGTLHEGGHALYEQGVAPNLERTFLAGGASLGVHESQSRLWENLVGRSRRFWSYYFPKCQAYFPNALQGVPLERFYRALNRVQPSLIRVEADELTYNLHILLRFELEIDLLEDRLKIDDLPAAWNMKMKNYLGLVPPKDSEGVLQDVHWSNGLIGYFPTYTLGNLISAQLFEKAVRDEPGILAGIEKGEFQLLLHWLRTHIHVHGRKFTSDELLRQATGEALNPSHYFKYLQDKFSEIYGI